MAGFLFLLVVAACLAPAIAASILAVNRDRSGGLWFLLGFVFSWLGVLIVACLSEPRAGYVASGRTEIDHGVRTLQQRRDDLIKRERQASAEDAQATSTLIPIPPKPSLEDVPGRPVLTEYLTGRQIRRGMKAPPDSRRGRQLKEARELLASAEAAWASETEGTRKRNDELLRAWAQAQREIQEENKRRLLHSTSDTP